MKLAKEQEAKEGAQERKDLTKDERLAQEQIKKLEEMLPEMPRFEGFFRSQSEGKHPFDEEQFKFKETSTAEDIKQEEAYDEELYQRELQGRLLNETLTPNQFQSLYGAKLDDARYVKFIKDNDRREYIDSRDMARLFEERKEVARRRLVLQGECSEAESYDRIRKELEEISQDAPTYEEEQQAVREFYQTKNFMQSIQSPERLLEKEYYFDEGLGESVKEHVEHLKKEFPDLQVEVRRDRDGYAIVKTQHKPTFKYSLDELDEVDPDQQVTQIKESLNDVLKTMLGGDSPHKLDKNQLESKLMTLVQNRLRGNSASGGETDNYDFDAATKESLSKLWKERTHGRYKNDREGFTKAFLEL